MIDLTTVRKRLGSHSPRRLTDDSCARAAVAAVLVGSDEAPLDILLIKRATQDHDPWSGQMALPGGRSEPGDVNLLATALRETREETGIELRGSEVLGELDDIRPLGKGLPRVIVRPFVFLLSQRPTVAPNHEVELYVWARFSDLPKVGGLADMAVDGATITVPAYFVGPHVVWGLTERILKSFIDLCL